MPTTCRSSRRSAAGRSSGTASPPRGNAGLSVLLPFAFSVAFALIGCDRGNAPPPPPTGTDAKPTVDVRPITPLLPRLQTHLAVDSRGNLYWTQESDPPIAGGDLVFAMGPEGVPQSIDSLTADRILAALGMPHAQGAIRSLCVGPGDQLYALFTGTNGVAPVCAVLQYSSVDHQLSVAADSATVTAASGMGPSILLARGTLLGSPQALWLWLRHMDGSALLSLSPRGERGLEVRRVSPQAVGDAEGLLKLGKGGEDLSLAQDGPLYYVDRPHATLWRITPDGRAAQVMPLAGLSQSLPPPAGGDGHLYFLEDAGPKFGGPDAALAAANPLARPNLADPVLFDEKLSDQRAVAFDRTRMTAPVTLPLADLQPRQLQWDSATGTLIAFDAASGEILRIKLPRSGESR